MLVHTFNILFNLNVNNHFSFKHIYLIIKHLINNFTYLHLKYQLLMYILLEYNLKFYINHKI